MKCTHAHPPTWDRSYSPSEAFCGGCGRVLRGERL